MDKATALPSAPGPSLSLTSESAQIHDGNSPQVPSICSRKAGFHIDGWVTEDMSSTTGRTHVMMLEPSIKTFSIPVVLVHGDYHTGDIWGPKPDNKPGWAEFFVKSGFTVYILDLPFRARPKPRSSGGKPATQLRAQMVEYHFTAPEKVKNLDWPSAHTHTQWPGTGLRGDPFFERYMRRVVPEFLDRRERQTAGQRALAIFLDKVGPSILIGQGSGANLAWLAADLMPHRVVGIVAIEPAGPPFSQAARIDEQEGRHRYTPKFHYAQNVRQYGIADIPLQFNPPPVQGTFADLLELDDNDFQPIPVAECYCKEYNASCFLQDTERVVDVKEALQMDGSLSFVQIKNPPRQLPNLRNIPQIIVTGEASPHSLFDWATFKWLKQAGVPIQHIELQHVGLRGNGHLCFLEKNSDEIAGFLLRWMRQNVPAIQQQFNVALEASRTPAQGQANSVEGPPHHADSKRIESSELRQAQSNPGLISPISSHSAPSIDSRIPITNRQADAIIQHVGNAETVTPQTQSTTPVHPMRPIGIHNNDHIAPGMMSSSSEANTQDAAMLIPTPLANPVVNQAPTQHRAGEEARSERALPANPKFNQAKVLEVPGAPVAAPTANRPRVIGSLPVKSQAPAPQAVASPLAGRAVPSNIPPSTPALQQAVTQNSPLTAHNAGGMSHGTPQSVPVSVSSLATPTAPPQSSSTKRARGSDTTSKTPTTRKPRGKYKKTIEKEEKKEMERQKRMRLEQPTQQTPSVPSGLVAAQTTASGEHNIPSRQSQS